MNSARILRGAALLGLAFPTLYASALRLLFLRILARQRVGDLGPLLARLAPDVHFVFPGESSWAADLRGREAVEAWERRFLAAGLELEPREILVSGPPWNTKIALHFDDHLTSEAGERVYENRGVIFGTVAWGKLKDFIVYEDTQKLGPLDEYLDRTEAAA
ncbi:MAG TPA: nuclear transport factor 2 family protein [Solirubrobacterales bacterium]|nr:nuclear transport factor 2 family protein [Solirubrobacterales bacterium]